MHKQWEDLIPFYIAQTLPRQEAAALEQHLAGCDVCRRSMDEWRAIATAVRTQAASQLRDLPPLMLPLSRAASGRRPVRRDPWRWMTPVSLVAAALAVVVGMGLIMLIVSRSLRPLEEPPQTSVAVLMTNTPQPTTPSSNPTAMVFSTLPPMITPSPMPILPTWTPRPPVQIFSPTRIPFTPQSGFGGAVESQIPTQPSPVPEVFVTMLPPTEMPFPTPTVEEIMMMMPDLPMDGPCRLSAAVSPISLYTGPGFMYAPLADLNAQDTLTPLAIGDNGWYRIEADIRGGSWVGWVRPDSVIVTGDCASLPVIPTQNYLPEVGVPTANVPFAITETPPQPTVEVVVTVEIPVEGVEITPE